MNFRCYQPGMPGVGMPNYPGPGMGPMPGAGMPGAGAYSTNISECEQLEHGLFRLEQEVKRLDARITRLETPYQKQSTYQQPYQPTQGFEMPESTYPSNMHMM